MDITKLTGNVVTTSMLDKVWLFYGAPGTRKTTVATHNTDETLLLAFEIGYKFIPGVKALPLTNWYGLKDAIRQLDDPAAKEMYKTVVIDTIGLAYKACVSYICALKGVRAIGEIPYGQGYSLAKDEFEKTILAIPQLGYGLVMIAHSSELDDEVNGYSVKVDIDKRPSQVIKGLADFILFARKERADNAPEGKDEMTVYAYSETSNPNIEVKSRARFFPKRFEFDYKNLEKALEDAIKQQDAFFKTESTDKPNFGIVKETEFDLDTTKANIVTLASELFKTPLSSRAAKIIETTLNGVRVSETTSAHAAQLYTIYDELLELKKSL